MNSFYSNNELYKVGFAKIGNNVLISRNASFYRPEAIDLGDHVRIDDFCILSGGKGISIGNYVHIGAFSALYGGAGIFMEDFSGLSPRCSLFSESDDFSGNSLIGPFFNKATCKPDYISAPIHLHKYSQVGTNSTLLPGVTLGEGTAIGAHSLVTRKCDEWSIYLGTPAMRIKNRSKSLLNLLTQRFEVDPIGMRLIK
jgi:acetyltransferase-like isoleucine patch superfamily enzyme